MPIVTSPVPLPPVPGPGGPSPEGPGPDQPVPIDTPVVPPGEPRGPLPMPQPID